MIVLDVSVAASIVNATNGAEALREFMCAYDEKIISPDFYQVEASNVLWKLAAYGDVNPSSVSDRYDAMCALVDEFMPANDLLTEALNEAVRLEHPVYDMLYFVLARRTGSTLFTLDKKLQQLCLDHGVDSVCTVKLPQ